ncbi:MAG TPA: PAS domain S-box protein [Methylobacter sp.]
MQDAPALRTEFPRRSARRYTHLDVGRNKPVRALSAGLAFPALRLPEKLPLLLTPLTYIHVGNAHLADAGPPYSGLHPAIKLREKRGVETLRNIALIVIFGLLMLAPDLAHADDALAQWRSKAGSIRQLLENDVPHAYAEAKHLQAELPDDATPSDRVRLLNLLARIENSLGETDISAAHAQQAFDLAKQHEDKAGQAEADIVIALDAVNKGNIDAMIAADTHSMAILDGVDRPDLLAEVMLRASMMYTRMEMPEESVAIAVQAMEIAKRGNDDWVLAYAYQGMAVAYDQNGRHAEGRDNYAEMLKHARAAHSKILEGTALLGIGTMLSNLGDFQVGERLIKQSITLYRTAGAPFYLGRSLFVLAENIRKQGQVAESIRILDEVEAIYQQRHNKIGLWWTLLKRSSNYQDLGKIAEADADAKNAYRLAKEINFTVYLSKSARRLSAIYAARGDYRQAYRLDTEADELSAKAAGDNAGKRMLDLTQRYQSESKQREIDKLNRRNQQQATELKHQSLEQRWLWTVLGGSIVMLVGSGFFLVRLRRSKDALKKSETLYRSVVTAMSEGMVLQESSGIIISLNPAAEKTLGLSTKQVLGRSLEQPPWSTIYEDGTPFPGDQHPAMMTLRTGQAQFDVVMGLYRTDGEIVWISINSQPLLIEGASSPHAVVTTFHDITERKRAEEELIAREREFRTLAESLPDNIVRYDQEGRVIYVNPVLEKTLGTIASKMLGTTVRERFPNGEYDDYAQLLDAVLTSGKIGEIEKIVTAPYSNLHLVHSIRMIAECDENGEVIGVLAIGRDITERKLAEQALRESEEKYRTLIQKIQVAVVVHGADTQILTSNLMAQEILGLSEDQLYGKTAIGPAWHFFHEDGRAASPDEYPVNKVLVSGKALKNYVLGVHRPGYEPDVWVLVNADPVFGKEGDINQVIVTFIDITQRKRAEHDIALMSQALGKVHEAAYLSDENARFLYVNDESCRALGYSRDELLTMSVMDIGPGWTLEMVREVLQRPVDEASQAFEAVHRRKDGSRFPVEINASQFEYAGKSYGLALVRDITERKQAEDEIRALNADLEQRVLERTEELRQQTRYLRTLIDTLPMRAWLKDKESRFLVVNQAMALACAHSVNDLVGKSDLDCWPREYAESYLASDSEVMSTGQRKTVEEPFVDVRNDVFWVETFKAPVLDEDGSVLGTVGISRDISDRKAMETAREDALAEAERLAKLRSEFMARMSHELRTPLNGILGYSQILLGENRGNERQSAMLNVIQQSGDYLLNLINDILDFAKIEAGKQELNLSDVPLHRFLRNLAGIITIKAEQKEVVFVCDVAADVPAGIRVDETRLRQVLLNLLSNAVKYSERGKVTLKVTVLKKPSPEGEEAHGLLRFEVQDNGIGINAGQLETIFRAFEQAGDRLHRTGTGLGLPISRELIRLMGSDIQVSSRVGEGSTFWFDLDAPVVEVCGDIMADEQHVAGYQGLRRRVLVVDDVNENRALLIDILSRLGFETFEAANGRECLDSVETQMPDLILLDMVMPEMDGLETVRRLRRLPGFGQTPIIAVSASASGYDVAEAMKAGVNVFLSKPIDIKRLMAQLAVLLKLDWIYALPETGGLPQQRFNESLIAPPLDEMNILHRLAQEGGMRDIIRYATHLEELDQRYRLFAAQLRALAQGYQSKAILDLVERYINGIETTRPQIDTDEH